jgi:uncharacterized protein (UPF0332 family)
MRSHEDIDTARLLLANGKHKVALTRAYYAIFYAASAMLFSEGIKRSKHSGVQSAFRQSFIRSGIIEAEYSDIYGAVRDARELVITTCGSCQSRSSLKPSSPTPRDSCLGWSNT